MTSSITYNLVMLTLDGITSFLQLMDVQSVRKDMCFSSKKNYGTRTCNQHVLDTWLLNEARMSKKEDLFELRRGIYKYAKLLCPNNRQA